MLLVDNLIARCSLLALDLNVVTSVDEARSAGLQEMNNIEDDQMQETTLSTTDVQCSCKARMLEDML